MATEELKKMKDQLVTCVQGQLGDIAKADAHELGEAVDMIKDLAEAIYYCTITQSMEKAEEEKPSEVNNINYYTTPVYQKMSPEYWPPDPYKDTDRDRGYMYYPGGGNGGNGNGSRGGSNGGNSDGSGNSGTGMGTRGSVNYYPMALPYEMKPDEYPMRRDPREGKAAMRRRMYMEGKENHSDTTSQLHELEAYLQELSSDITEMIKDASPEEKATLHQKMTTLASKLA